ncbi:hypothetical protein [Myroides sp. WP-1]|uniref:hypothetical protein n=1 Tax=Myroides sp. WP-1 TaxID=2759944 RepID=UPI0015FA03BA|nr:hypothetical protein [Myroides sp. WP-1]MBB1140809.1 hypothetical protein [Myroides sp. WP-1]
MEQYYRHSFFVDAGVNLSIGKEVNKLQTRFGFSEEMRKLLLVQSQGKGTLTLGPSLDSFASFSTIMQWYTLDGLDDTLDVIERNEDFILADFLFVFAQDTEGNQYAEITKGRLKGHIVWLNACYYEDVDSLEELLEEYSEQSESPQIKVDDELVFHLLYTSNQLVSVRAQSLELFLC